MMCVSMLREKLFREWFVKIVCNNEVSRNLIRRAEISKRIKAQSSLFSMRNEVERWLSVACYHDCLACFGSTRKLG